MVQQSFHDRIARIEQKGGRLEMLSGPAESDGPRGGKSGKAATAGKAPNGPGVLKILMIGMLMVPVGMAIGLMTKLFLDPDITPEAANYMPLMAFVAAAHLALFTGVVTALVSRFRRMTLNYVMLFVFAGYGIASAALSAALQ
jgi:hypothetical protein